MMQYFKVHKKKAVILLACIVVGATLIGSALFFQTSLAAFFGHEVPDNAPSGGTNDRAGNTIMDQLSAVTGSGSWVDYLNGYWAQERAAFHFTYTELPKWNGQQDSSVITEPIAGGARRWKVQNGGHLRYALRYCASGDIVELTQDIDLNGNEYHWESGFRTYGITNVILEGNNHTIYNLGVTDNRIDNDDNLNQNREYRPGLLRWLNGCTVRNLTFESAKLVARNARVAIFGKLYKDGTKTCIFDNVHVKNSLAFSGGADRSVALLVGVSGESQRYNSAPLHTLRNVSVSGSFTYGVDHVSTLGSFTSGCEFINCYSVDSSVVSTGKHSGGFVSCLDSNSNFTNCFTNNVIFGLQTTGVFVGDAGNGSIFRNCFAAGTIEGVSELGGFTGCSKTGHGEASGSFGRNQYINCYSTSLVGLRSNGTRLGGFVGYLFDGRTPDGHLFQNCYAAGETGSLDTNVAANRGSSSVGGFLGYNGSYRPVVYQNSYYDKQTTAMKEWASGANYNSGISKLTGLDGVLTTNTVKSGTGLASAPGSTGFKGFTNDNEWFYQDGYYPQLAVFASATAANWGSEEHANLVKAYSEASAATVFLEPWDTLDTETYDTVRDLTLRFHLSSGAQTNWEKQGQTATIYGENMAILELGQFQAEGGSQTWYADEFVPGREWLTAKCDISGQVGRRSLRVVPTAHITAGPDQTVFRGETYDHADTVAMAFSTGVRTDQDPNDITVGIYPDDNLTSTQQFRQQKSVSFAGRENLFVDVDVSHLSENVQENAYGSTVTVKGYRIDEVHDSGKLSLTALNLNNNQDGTLNRRFNGSAPFDALPLVGYYLLDYTWKLHDGRYLQDEKLLTVKTNPLTVSVKVLDANGNAIARALHLDASQGSSYQLSAGTIASDAVQVNKNTPAMVAWKAPPGSGVAVEKLSIQMGIDETHLTKVERDNPAPGDSLAIPRPVFTGVSYDSGNFYVKTAMVTRNYTIQQDASDTCYLQFNLNQTDPATSYAMQDVEEDIEVVLNVNRGIQTAKILHIRQIILEQNNQIALPVFGFMQVKSVLGSPAISMNITTTSGTDTSLPFHSYKLDAGYVHYRVMPIIPQYYTEVGYFYTDMDRPHDPAQRYPGKIQNRVFDYSAKDEYWVTLYLRPSVGAPGDYFWDWQNNDFHQLQP